MASKRFIIVARSDVAAAANLAAKSADCDPIGGDRTFTVGLSSDGTPPAVAYWCSWQMTLAQAAAIRTRLRNRGATVAEVTPVARDGSPDSNRFAVFDADDGWDAESVLKVLGLQRVEYPW